MLLDLTQKLPRISCLQITFNSGFLILEFQGEGVILVQFNGMYFCQTRDIAQYSVNINILELFILNLFQFLKEKI